MKSPFIVLGLLLVSMPAFALNVGEESVPADEAPAIARINATMEKFMDKRYGNSTPGAANRAVHPKAHGCAKGVFKVNASLPAWAKAGIFQEGAQYNAWLRFSNANPVPQADKEGDSRGFAFKVLGAHGPRILEEDQGGHTQDFSFNSFPVFFAKDGFV